MVSTKPEFLDGIIVTYVYAPVARFAFPFSGKSVDLLLDTGSYVTWVPIDELCPQACALEDSFECQYMKGACSGKLFQVTMKLGDWERTQTVGGASKRQQAEEGVVGLDMHNFTELKHQSLLRSWGHLKHPTFGFIPHSLPQFRYKLRKTKTAQMYIGKPLDAANLCIEEPVLFPVSDPGGHGRWYTNSVHIFIDGHYRLTVPVLWDTGTSKTMAHVWSAHLKFPSPRHLVELGYGTTRVGQTPPGTRSLRLTKSRARNISLSA